MFKVLVTGHRRSVTGELELLIRTALAMVAHGRVLSDLLLVHGAAEGVDSYAKHVWNAFGLEDKDYPYKSELGKAGGQVRNTEMVNDGADICLAFPDEKSIGTWDCVRKAKTAGIPTFVIKNKSDLFLLKIFLEDGTILL